MKNVFVLLLLILFSSLAQAKELFLKNGIFYCGAISCGCEDCQENSVTVKITSGKIEVERTIQEGDLPSVYHYSGAASSDTTVQTLSFVSSERSNLKDLKKSKMALKLIGCESAKSKCSIEADVFSESQSKKSEYPPTGIRVIGLRDSCSMKEVVTRHRAKASECSQE